MDIMEQSQCQWKLIPHGNTYKALISYKDKELGIVDIAMHRKILLQIFHRVSVRS